MTWLSKTASKTQQTTDLSNEIADPKMCLQFKTNKTVHGVQPLYLGQLWDMKVDYILNIICH